MESASSISPAALLSRLRTFAFIALALRPRFSRRFRGCGIAIGLFGFLHRTWGFRILRKRALHGVSHHDPAAFVAGHGALHHDEPALHIHLRHFEVLCGHAVCAVMAVHLLVLEGLAGILATTGAAKRTVRNRHAMARLKSTEVPPLHRA